MAEYSGATANEPAACPSPVDDVEAHRAGRLAEQRLVPTRDELGEELLGGVGRRLAHRVILVLVGLALDRRRNSGQPRRDERVDENRDHPGPDERRRHAAGDVVPLLPDAAASFAPIIIGLAVIAILYGALVAMVQPDMKKLVAYSSIAHMGFVTLGFFIFSELGMSGGIVQMVSHGFVSGAMFLCIGVLYDRVHSREIAAYGGVAHTMPRFAAFAVLFAMANCGLPGTAGFVGEWMVILGTVKTSFWLAALAATTLVFGAAYTLWMVKRVYFGDVANAEVKALADLDARELTVLSALAIAVLWMGVYPKPFTDVMNVSVGELIKHVAQPKLP